MQKQTSPDTNKEISVQKTNSSKLKKEPLTIRSFRNFVKSQEMYTNYLQHNEPKPLNKPKQWTLKQLLNIADRQSQAIQTTRFFNIRSSSKKSRDKSKEKEKDKSDIVPVVEEKFIEEKVGESARIKLVKILSFHKVDQNGQNNDKKQFFKLNLSQIRHENQSQGSIRKNLIKINTSRLKEVNSANSSMCDQKSKQLQDIKQKIQNIISTTDRKILISYSSTVQQLQLTSARKSCYRAQKKLRRIIREVIQVVKFMLKYRLWFCYPITYNKTFLQKVQDKQFEQIKNELTQDPEMVYIRNQYGQTPLHLACIQNNFTLAKLFITKHCYINSLDSYELTPLFYALQSNSTLCLKLLLDSNASPWSPPGQKIDFNNLTNLMKDMINQSRIIDILRIWKREVKIKFLVKQFGKLKN